jgi:hypothetical protein
VLVKVYHYLLIFFLIYCISNSINSSRSIQVYSSLFRVECEKNLIIYVHHSFIEKSYSRSNFVEYNFMIMWEEHDVKRRGSELNKRLEKWNCLLMNSKRDRHGGLLCFETNYSGGARFCYHGEISHAKITPTKPVMNFTNSKQTNV